MDIHNFVIYLISINHIILITFFGQNFRSSSIAQSDIEISKGNAKYQYKIYSSITSHARQKNRNNQSQGNTQTAQNKLTPLTKTNYFYPLFALPILLIPLHSIFSFFFNFPNPLNHSIPFYFFSTIFFNFPNPYAISLNLNNSYHLEINKVKPFLQHFYKPFSNYSKSFSNYFFHHIFMAKMTTPNKGLFK